MFKKFLRSDQLHDSIGSHMRVESSWQSEIRSLGLDQSCSDAISYASSSVLEHI